MPNVKNEITYDFTLLINDTTAYTLTDEYRRLYEEHFEMFKTLFGDVVLEPGAYRVKITEYDDLRTVSVIRVYYY